MKIEEFVEKFNIYLKDTKFIIVFVNEVFIHDKSKYVQIVNKNDRSCYMDWKYDKFDDVVLKKYGEHISTDQGIMNDEDDVIAKEYLELSDLILKFSI